MSTDKPSDPIEVLRKLTKQIINAADGEGLTHIRATGSVQHIRDIIAALEAERARTKKVAEEMRQWHFREGLVTMGPEDVRKFKGWIGTLDPSDSVPKPEGK